MKLSCCCAMVTRALLLPTTGPRAERGCQAFVPHPVRGIGTAFSSTATKMRLAISLSNPSSSSDHSSSITSTSSMRIENVSSSSSRVTGGVFANHLPDASTENSAAVESDCGLSESSTGMLLSSSVDVSSSFLNLDQAHTMPSLEAAVFPAPIVADSSEQDPRKQQQQGITLWQGRVRSHLRYQLSAHQNA